MSFPACRSVTELQRDWCLNARWAGIARPYPAEEVERLRGVSARYRDSRGLTTAPTTDDAPYFFQFLRWPIEREGDDPTYFYNFSVPGYSLGINALLYALTH